MGGIESADQLPVFTSFAPLNCAARRSGGLAFSMISLLMDDRVLRQFACSACVALPSSRGLADSSRFSRFQVRVTEEGVVTSSSSLPTTYFCSRVDWLLDCV